MNKTLPVIGLDVSKKSLDLCLRVGEKVHTRQVPNTAEGYEQMSAWMRQRGVSQAHVCLEATGTYSDGIALFVYQQGHQVSVLNPAWVAAFRKSEGKLSKTDAQDAALLARFGEQKRPLLWEPTSEQVQELQGLVQRLDDLEHLCQQECNRLENTRWSERVREQIETTIVQLNEQIMQVKQWMKEAVAKAVEVKHVIERLDSIVGVAQLSATRFVSVIQDITRFSSVEQLVAFAGVDPCDKQSGTSVHGRSTISKHGSAQLRKWLYQCALVMKRWDPDVKQWAEELRKKGKAKKQVIVAVMRKLLHIIYGIWKSGRDYEPRTAFPSHYGGVSEAAVQLA